MTPTWLSLDLETRSQLDLKRTGVGPYAEDPSTGVWCMSYAFDDQPIQRWTEGMKMPTSIRNHIQRSGLIRAWNASFEMTLWEHVLTPRHGFIPVPLEQWVCTAALAARCGLPRALGYAAKVLGLPQQKDEIGSRLMKQFHTRTSLTPEELLRLQAYCDDDVRTERAVFHALPEVGHPMERALWLLDQRINRRGLLLDVPLIQGMRSIGNAAQAIIDAKLAEVTGGAVEKATQVARLLAWVQKHGVKLDGLDKAQLRDALKPGVLDRFPDEVRQALLLRQKGAKSSLKKLDTMMETKCADDRVRHTLLYHAAGTGRWGGKGIQPQNFPRPTVKVTPEDIEWLRRGELEHPPKGKPVMQLLATAIRSCIIAAPGNEFTVYDFAQIEARVLAWVANCRTLLEQFRRGESPYLPMGQVIFGRPITKADAFQYQISKNTVLGCGYQMGADRFREQAWEQTGEWLPVDLCQRAVDAYRSTYWEIPMLWKALNLAARTVVNTGTEAWTAAEPFKRVGIAFRMNGGWLQLRLPSGRSLWYARPRIRPRKTPWGDVVPAVVVEGVNSQTKKWGRQALYGGLLTENIVQAIARDIMGAAMLRLEEAGYTIVTSVHDEIVSEHPEGFGSTQEFEHIMITPPTWAADCPIAAEGWRGKRYKKR